MEFLYVVLGLLVLLTIFSLKIVRQAEAIVIERLGKFQKVCYSGIQWVWPIIDKVAAKISLKERVADFPPQEVITKDNVKMAIDTVVYYRILDPKLYCYGVERPTKAIELLTATTLRNLIGELELDGTLTSRDTINVKMTKILDEATDPWGIKVNRVELKNIMPPKDIQEAMDKQMKAERERREAILKAEGEKKAAILTAEGIKESMVLKAEAEKEALIAQAQGKAEALRAVYTATAQAIEAINAAKPSKEYIQLESYKALEKVADGQATKLIIPSDLQNITSLASVVKEVVKK